ncbi:peptidase [Anaerococcus obesiensis]|uniref:peptidase n=1 Tax=Anaerococcus obesiensis TaxID=1287640 RepID=UPI003996340B
MNKNKKIISASLALALGVSLLIPDAKANEEKTLEKILKEPAKTSETVKTEEKPTVEDKKITIKKAPVNEKGEEKPDDETEKPDGETEKPEGGEEKPDGETEKPDDKKENSETDEEKSKDEKKVKPKEYKMSELLNEKGAFEKSKQAHLGILGFEIMQSAKDSSIGEETVDAMRRQYEKLQKATTWDEMAKILGYSKEVFARELLEMKGEKDAYDGDLVKIIDDMANQKPQNPSPKNPNRKNKKTGKTNATNTINTGNKVSNAGENVQTGVGSLSAILGLLGASSLGLFKSKRK